jgi:release factor glutamine methyltransferase
MTTGIGDALAEATAWLGAVSDTPRLDAELLMAHALGIEREQLLLDAARLGVPEAFAALVERRMGHEPVAYIIGYRDFWSVRIAVGPGVLIPRPDSETLIEAAVAHFAGTPGPATILDLGTGPGTLLIAALAEWPDALGLGVDVSEEALDYARANAAQLPQPGRAVFRTGDWADGLSGPYDLILANPPYIEEGTMLDRQVAEHEPPEALFAGADGLDDYRCILPALRRLLAADGLAVIEIGWQQREAVTALAAENGLAVTCHRDLGGRDRVLACRPA